VALRKGPSTLLPAIAPANAGNVIELTGAGADGGIELPELYRAECLMILARKVIGRVLFTDAALPAAQPVTYLLDPDNEEIIFRATAGSKLATAARHAVVGFQVDDINPQTHTACNVLAVGQAYEVTEPDRLTELARQQAVTRTPDTPVHVMAIPLHRLTGQHVYLN
jgi:nitroimidazol reductase NimA-like FMN-containing flavoprotein (pyridoxamine 5'-phosphate oxidase superfamily)